MTGEAANNTSSRPPGHGTVRVYRKQLFRRVVVAIVVPFIVLSLLAMIGMIFLTGGAAGKIAGVIMLAGIALALAWLLLVDLTYKITLTDNAITVSYFGSQRTLANSEIAGRLDVRSRNRRWLTIVPTDPRAKPLQLGSGFDSDGYFESRISALCDLVAEGRKASEAEIAGDVRYGSTPEERLRRLARARSNINGLNTVAAFAALWCMFAPWPYLAAVGVAAILPLLATIMVATSGGLVRFFRLRTEVYAIAGGVPFLCAIALALRAHWDVYLVDWGPALKFGGGAGLALLALAVLADRSLTQRIRVLAGAAIIAITYGVAVLVLADISFDQSAGQDFRSQVLGSHISRSKSTRYFLKLAPWGPQQSAEEVSVSHDTFDRLMPGASVCPRLYDGAVGIRWFTISFCPPDAAIPFE